ncbi:LOW QUALITY PROTEIN: uncharacterized protein LOC100908537 [Galendromus occidentalis]|uniref:LOW QUALITY PROTEIN: uncharacterized protein LOC100908537 n=1 Tax=Galendromus occidentalis TaxID=34638 RepID=A0AAJ7SJC9_9ACAR|nr:LOW QUALITY PROTEIN: uncharacterized protein LOC100908537 [Galendromus occidentalis]
MSSAARALETLWSLEALGISDPPAASQMSADEEEATRQFNSEISFEDGHYVVSFPKRPSISQLQNNLGVASQRLERKLSQLRQYPMKYRRYHAEVMKFIDDGFAVEVRDFSPGSRSEVDGSYYMPHHEVVVTSEKAEKWRIVFDCSAKQKGASSLNDHLLPGPNLNPDLVSLLLNFRLHSVAVSADVSKAYMRIAVAPADQPLFRFLWKGPDADSVRAYQMQRVTWGAASSGFLLAATIRHHLQGADPASQDLSKCLYADDFLQSFEDPQRAIQFTDNIRRTLKSAGMNLAKWKTNSKEVDDHLLSNGVKPDEFDSTASGFLKVLGISWCPSQDVLLFTTPASFDGLELESALTKRRVLSLVASIFDPLGWLTPFTLRAKMIIQQLWAIDLKWNDTIPDRIREEFRAWMSEVGSLSEIKLRRRYSNISRTPSAYLLHSFGDASQTAYSCASYIEIQYSDGPSDFALVMTKSRLAPRDSPSLPRLELLAALIAVRLKRFLTERMNVKFERALFYTDSTIAYHWATSSNPGCWKQFVSNRVREIQADSRPEDWFHLKGNFNISDLATRLVSAATLIQDQEWWYGPSWLRLPRERRPLSQPQRESVALDPVSKEMRGVLAVVTTMDPVLKIERFSTACRATRVLAHVLRFAHIARRRPVPTRRGLYRHAESILIRWCQERFLCQEISSVRVGEKVPSGSKLAAYKLFIGDDGLLRIETRLRAAPHSLTTKETPVVVPGESRLAKLLVVDAHRINAHFGVNTILNILRRRFWITRGRQVIRAVLRQCVVCRKRHGGSAEQIEAPSPESRSTLQAPFAVAGVDFCGPFYTKQRAETFKSYVALFTCTATRGIHLELVPSLSTPQTHLAIRRFLSIYPACHHFISDNGTSFGKAATEIKRLFNSTRDPEVLEILDGRSVDWSFNCPRAPWRGGFFERCVGIVKSALAKTLGKTLIGYEEFRTILCELAATVNDRPISHVDSDCDVPAALTPAHFLRGGPYVPASAPLIAVDSLGGDELPTEDALRRAHDSKTRYFRDLSVRWFREYLLLLRSAVGTRGRESAPLRVGDVCLLRDDNLPRVRWRLVRVLAAHPGRDGETRTYTVKFGNLRTSRRAAQLLIPLELSADRPETPSPALPEGAQA